MKPEFILLLLCALCSCKSLDKKIVKMSEMSSKAQPLVVIQPPTLTITRAVTNLNLQWIASPDADATGYNVYWGFNPGECDIEIPLGNVTNVTLSIPFSGTTNYFAVQATNDLGDSSILSGEASIYLPLILRITCNGQMPNAHLESSADLIHWQECAAIQTNGDWIVSASDQPSANMFFRITN